MTCSQRLAQIVHCFRRCLTAWLRAWLRSKARTSRTGHSNRRSALGWDAGGWRTEENPWAHPWYAAARKAGRQTWSETSALFGARNWRSCEAALARYRERDWAGAVELFERALRLRYEDGPSRLLIARCRANQAHPSEADWDGVRRIDTK